MMPEPPDDIDTLKTALLAERAARQQAEARDLGAEEWFRCIMPPSRSRRVDGPMNRSSVIWISDGPSNAPI